MCLDTITDTNETLNIVPGDNFDADTDLEYDEYFYNAVSDEDNKNLHTPILPTLSDESAFPMIAVTMLLTIFIKIFKHVVEEVLFVLMVLLLVLIIVQNGVHHTCAGGHERKKNNPDEDNLDGPDVGLQINQN